MANLRHAKILNQMKIFYEPYFGDWTKLHDSLSQPSQHCALLNKYCKSVDEIVPTLRSKELMEISLNYNITDSSKSYTAEINSGTTDVSQDIRYGENNMQEYVDGQKVSNFNLLAGTRFPSPHTMVAKRGEILPYYLMDLSSLLPVIALDIHSNDRVLDMCASPGGKSVAISQFLSGGQLISNDNSQRRLVRLKKVINEYIPEVIQQTRCIFIVNWSGELFGMEEKCGFDKVLVDAPCSSERHVVQKEFQYGGWSLRKMKENAKLQQNLVLSGLRTLKPGGTLVYSTCSISPLENENVVKNAVDLSKKDGIKVSVVDKDSLLNDTINRLSCNFFHVSDNTSNGVLVLPTPLMNWGPMYFSKMYRLE